MAKKKANSTNRVAARKRVSADGMDVIANETLNASSPLGAHMSIAGGMEKAIERGTDVGCECVQIFTKNRTCLHSV